MNNDTTLASTGKRSDVRAQWLAEYREAVMKNEQKVSEKERVDE